MTILAPQDPAIGDADLKDIRARRRAQSPDDRAARRRQVDAARRLPSILPPLEPSEMLEVSMIRSLAGDLAGGRIGRARPFRAPHHSASMAALVGGGTRPRPGEAALAHLGVLFLDELPEFHPQVLDALRHRSRPVRR